MSDHLLRLAKLTLRLAGDVLSEMSPEGRNLHAGLSDLVRDLEAAPDRNVLPSPATERRTITREEFDAAVRELWLYDADKVNRLVKLWRLTVEDA